MCGGSFNPFNYKFTEESSSDFFNRLRFDRIMVMSLWPQFLAHPVNRDAVRGGAQAPHSHHASPSMPSCNLQHQLAHTTSSSFTAICTCVWLRDRQENWRGEGAWWVLLGREDLTAGSPPPPFEIPGDVPACGHSTLDKWRYKRVILTTSRPCNVFVVLRRVRNSRTIIIIFYTPGSIDPRG